MPPRLSWRCWHGGTPSSCYRVIISYSINRWIVTYRTRTVTPTVKPVLNPITSSTVFVIIVNWPVYLANRVSRVIAVTRRDSWVLHPTYACANRAITTIWHPMLVPIVTLARLVTFKAFACPANQLFIWSWTKFSTGASAVLDLLPTTWTLAIKRWAGLLLV
jgi:hypothetical protein